MKKFNFIFDQTSKAISLKNYILRKYKSYSPSLATHFIILGGDGFMLKNIKKFHKYKKPFYGINCGTYGFLMNNLNMKNLEQKISIARKAIINTLSIDCFYGNNLKKKLIAINEISIFRQSKQTASISIKKGKNFLIQKLVADGVLVSTPAGSTAYNLSVHGPILNLESKKLAITPISPFRPRRWKGQITSEKTKIIIQNLDISKRPISAVADNIEFRNAHNILISTNNKIKFNLLYDSNRSLQKKIKLEVLRREIN